MAFLSVNTLWGEIRKYIAVALVAASICFYKGCEYGMSVGESLSNITNESQIAHDMYQSHDQYGYGLARKPIPEYDKGVHTGGRMDAAGMNDKKGIEGLLEEDDHGYNR
jgi:hypothetical protein